VERKEEGCLRGGAGGHGLGFKAEAEAAAAADAIMQSCKPMRRRPRSNTKRCWRASGSGKEY
jgi:hypothetical protein